MQLFASVMQLLLPRSHFGSHMAMAGGIGEIYASFDADSGAELCTLVRPIVTFQRFSLSTPTLHTRSRRRIQCFCVTGMPILAPCHRSFPEFCLP